MDVGLVTGPTRYIETIGEFDNFLLRCAVLFYFILIKLELEKEFQLKFYVIWNLVSVTPACNNCNFQLKTTGRKRKATSSQHSNDNKKLKLETDEDFFLSVVFHSLKSYDGHFVIKHLKKKYTERKNADGKPPTYDITLAYVKKATFLRIKLYV